jgi:hypothetical protein
VNTSSMSLTLMNGIFLLGWSRCMICICGDASRVRVLEAMDSC